MLFCLTREALLSILIFYLVTGLVFGGNETAISCANFAINVCADQIHGAEQKVVDASRVLAGMESAQDLGVDATLFVGEYCVAVAYAYNCLLGVAQDKCPGTNGTTAVLQQNISNSFIDSLPTDYAVQVLANSDYQCYQLIRSLYGQVDITPLRSQQINELATRSPSTMCLSNCSKQYITDPEDQKALSVLPGFCDKYKDLDTCLKSCSAPEISLATCLLPKSCSGRIYVQEISIRRDSMAQICKMLDESVPCQAPLIDLADFKERKQIIRSRLDELRRSENFTTEAPENCQLLVQEYIDVADGRQPKSSLVAIAPLVLSSSSSRQTLLTFVLCLTSITQYVRYSGG